MLSENEYGNPAEYWERRLGGRLDLVDAGYRSLGHRFNRILYAARLRSFEKVLGESGGEIVGRSTLDVGCGTGFYTEMCHRKGAASYTGIDITAVSVTQLSAQYPGFRFIRADVGNEGFDLGEQFDVVIAGDILFHIVDDRRLETAIRNISRCLAPSGRVVFSEVLPVDTVQSTSHCRFRTLEFYRRLLLKYGMVVDRVEPIFAALQPPLDVRDTSLGWHLYAFVWRVGLMRLARYEWFDRWVPVWLDWLDRRVLLPRANIRTPNSKWLIAIKGNAS